MGLFGKKFKKIGLELPPLDLVPEEPENTEDEYEDCVGKEEFEEFKKVVTDYLLQIHEILKDNKLIGKKKK